MTITNDLILGRDLAVDAFGHRHFGGGGNEDDLVALGGGIVGGAAGQKKQYRKSNYS